MTQQDTTYRIAGGRTGVLLIHGMCGTPAEMRFVANGLARTGYTVHCPQISGQCGSEANVKAATWQEWYACAERALDELRQECDIVIVGGLSSGAVLALLLAANRPQDIHALTLFAPTLWLNGWTIPWYARLFRIVNQKFLANLIDFPDRHPHGIKDARIREFIKAALSSSDASVAGMPNTPGGAVLEHRWLVRALMKVVSTIRQPTLILHPREDDYAALSNLSYLQRNLAGLVDTVVLDDSYHIVTIDRQRHVVVERTTAFIDRIAKQFSSTAARTASVAAVRAA